MKKLILFLVIILMGCSSAELVENWKNPDIVIFDASKVLVIGMTDNENARDKFERKLKKEFNKRNVEAMRSIDVFDVDFTNSKRSEKELDEVEESLLDKGFDAIVLTKITGAENRKTLTRSVNELYNSMEGFKEDYRQHQDIYYEEDYYQNYKVYHAETSLYCICVGKERSLIWRGAIDIVDPRNIEKTIDDYIDLVVLAMEEQDLIFRKDPDDEITGI
ncbi:MAG TPA: hypothetical protein VKN36_18710 [Eudoraea sp.]|nr:hypothetical protein [Eudoraea sp.]